MVDLSKVIYEGSNFVVVDVIDQLPKHKNYPHGSSVTKPDGTRAIPASWSYRKRRKRISKVFVHQTAGSYTPGWKGCYNTAAFITRDPTYKPDGRWRGTGRGWPAMCYTFYVPHEPERTIDGRWVVFLCRPLEMTSWHTAGHNDEAVAIGFQGYFRSRHIRNYRPFKGTDGAPSQAQLAILSSWWNEYATEADGLALSKTAIYGHFEAKKPKKTCPGDMLEKWVLKRRGEDVQEDVVTSNNTSPSVLDLPEHRFLPLHTWELRQAALVFLGFDLGRYGPRQNGVDGKPGYRTRAAIEAFEEVLGLQPDGNWDEQVELLIQLVLLSLGATRMDLVKFF